MGDEAADSGSGTHKVNPSVLYDTQFLKKHLDDHAIQTIKEAGYAESTKLGSVRIVLSVVAVAAAVCSHFVLKDFKKQQVYMIALIAVWIVCSAVMAIMEWYFTGGTTNATFVGFPVDAKPLKRVCLMTTLPRFSTAYTVVMNASRSKLETVQVTLHYNNYFTAEGEFASAKFRKDVLILLESLEASTTKKAD